MNTYTVRVSQDNHTLAVHPNWTLSEVLKNFGDLFDPGELAENNEVTAYDEDITYLIIKE